MLKTYTAKEIHQAFVLAFINYLSEHIREIEGEKKEYSLSEANTLKELGFTSSKRYTEITEAENFNRALFKAKEERVKFILFLDEIFRYFGQGVLLISRQHFSELLRKYDLVCGLPSDFTGEIPPEMYEDLTKAKKNYEYMINIVHPNPYSYDRTNYPRQSFMNEYPTLYDMFSVCEYCKVSEVEAGFFSKRSKAVQNLVRFPFVKTGFGSLPGEINGHKVSYQRTDHHNFFIAAPRKEMKTIAFVKEIALPQDPFVFSMTKYGALIYCSWGEEAKDQVIQNYRDLYSKVLAQNGVEDIDHLRKKYNNGRGYGFPV
jgi:hypothetical protein